MKLDYSMIAGTYASGLSLVQTSEHHSITVGAVRYALRITGTASRPRDCGIGKKRIPNPRYGQNIARHQFDWVLAKTLYLGGDSLNQIASRFNVGAERVRYALKQMGVDRRARGSAAGKGNHQYKGGTRNRRDGYVVVRGSRLKPLQHRVIAERVLGRPLKPNEVVHHINCDRSDNRNENLLICTQEYHMQLHARMRRHPYWSEVGKKNRGNS